MPATATDHQQPTLAHAPAPAIPVQVPAVWSINTSHALIQPIIDSVCLDLALGLSLRSLCSKPGMPNICTFLRWCESNPTWQKQYARARQEQAHYLAEECLEIANNCTPENAHQARLMVDTRKWYAGKMHSHVYGDRPQDITVNTQVNVTLPEAELRSLQQRKQVLLEARQAKAMPAKARLLSI